MPSFISAPKILERLLRRYLLMRSLLCSILFVYAGFALGQSRSIKLDWSAPTSYTIGTMELKLPHFTTDFVFEEPQIYFRRNIAVGRENADFDLVITDLVTEQMQTSELYDLHKNGIPLQFTSDLKSALSRKQSFQQLTVSPIYKDGATYRRVRSFTATLNVRGQQFARPKSTPFGNSVLASGAWFRFKVDKTGVHRLDRRFLESLGMNVNGLDPRTIKIYGHGGKSLPLVNGETIALDPPELAIKVSGEEDGRFDSSDLILFYGVATNTDYVRENDSFINPYSDDSYYYITSNGSNGKRILPQVQPSGTPVVTYDYYDAPQHHEEDKINIGRIGRVWYGEPFAFEAEQTFEFTFSNVVGTRPSFLQINTGSISDTASSFTYEVNGTAVGTGAFFGIATNNTSTASQRSVFLTNSLAIANNIVTVKVTYNNNGNPSAQGYLDYISLIVPQQLTGVGKQFKLANSNAALQTGIVRYQFANAAAIEEVWDITDPYNITKITNGTASSLFSFVAQGGVPRVYQVIDPADYYSAINISNRRVANQNLKGTIFKTAISNFLDIDYLIITPAFLRSEAQRLANYHITRSNLNTKVVTLEDIYTEFSEGKQDLAAIRNFVKYVYDNASAPSKRVQYLNLFGDASFDYKDRIAVRDNIVPAFLSVNSESLVVSYCTDDFFTYMDPNEGDVGSNNLMDLAVGRMIVSDLTEAREMVDKTISYTAEPAFNKWRNNVTLIGDDIDKLSSDRNIQVNVNALADEIFLNRPDYNVNKILLDSYEQVSGASGERYPDAVNDIRNAFEQGSLVINYYGHGNEDGLAQEFVVTQSLVRSLRNPDTLPLFITVTCEFTRYDNPLRVSGGELTYLNPQGGAIALVATNRLIGIGAGAAFNDRLDDFLFQYDNDEPISMAESLRLAKISLGNDGNRRVIAFVGDPALKLAFPLPKVVLTTVNGSPAMGNTQVLRGLDRVTLAGQVQNISGTILSDYNGTLSATIYDKLLQRETLGNDGFTDNSGQLITINFTELGEVLFRGQATIENGLFEFSFVMPRDTQIPVGEGRVSFYAKRANLPEDQNGFSRDLTIGGINRNAPTDDLGPEIQLFMNDTNFVSGGITNKDPYILAFLEDDNGINTSSGIGHDITATIDGDDVNPVIMNDYYEAEVDDFKKGKVFFPLRDIAPGLHTLVVKAWDTYNNSNTQEIQFLVADNNELKLERVLNYPNPFTSYTEFWFNHNRPFEPLEVQVQVMTITGKVVWAKNQNITTTGFTSREITWDGLDDFGQRLGKGVYIYKITVKSTLTNQVTSKTEKLVIL